MKSCARCEFIQELGETRTDDNAVLSEKHALGGKVDPGANDIVDYPVRLLRFE